VSFLKSTFPILIFSLLILTFICGCEKSTGPKKDTTPPAAITDFKITIRSDTSATLSWTAPGDDGNIGKAAVYALRYSTDMDVLLEWNFALRVLEEPIPEPAGATQQHTVMRLTPDSGYYFAIKTQDDAGNWSLLSNIASEISMPKEIAFVSNRDGDYDIFLLSAVGLYTKKLTDLPGDESEPAWSPDGEKIAFVSTHNGKKEVFMVNADGSGQMQLTFSNWSCHTPVFSPDGTKIAFTADSTYLDEVLHRDIYVMNSDGTESRNLTPNSGPTDGWPSWSPDGTRMACTSNRDGNYEIYVMNFDGSNQRNLTENDAGDFDPLWSPDGTQIAFRSNRDGPYDIFLMNPQGEDPRNITSNWYSEWGFAWSPDGEKIAFHTQTSWEPVFPYSDYHVFIANPDGTNQKMLTDSHGFDMCPCFSPDGAMIVFESSRDGNSEIYLMNTDGSEQRNLSYNSGDDHSPVWSRADR
jgi:Tol biopolymer transport system component